MAEIEVHEWSGIRFAKDSRGWRECSCGYVASNAFEADMHQDKVVAGKAVDSDWPDYRRGLKPRSNDGKK